MKCKLCGSGNGLEVSITLKDGTTLAFSRCHSCETNRWAGPDGELTRERVLALTAAHAPKR